MQHFGVWGLAAGGFQPLRKSELDFGPSLEQWLAQTPALLAPDLTIVGRRLAVGEETIDLLALDGDGRWRIIAITPGLIERERLIAALQQAAYLHKMAFDDLAALVNGYLNQQENGPRTLARLLTDRNLPPESGAQQREIQIFLVGTALAPGAAELIAYLHGRYHLPLHTALYAIYEDGGDQRFLVRESDPAAPPASFAPPPRPDVRPHRRPPEQRDDEGEFIIFPPPGEPERARRSGADPVTNHPIERPSAQSQTPADLPSGFHETMSWAREQSSQVWRRARTAVGFAPSNFAYTPEQQRQFEDLLDLAGQHGLRDVLRPVLEMAERQQLQPTFGDGWVQLGRPDLDPRPLFIARARAKPQERGQLTLHLNYDALAAAFGRSQTELFERLGRNELRRVTANNVASFIKAFAALPQKK